MSKRPILGAVALCCFAIASIRGQDTTHLIWALDSGSQANPNPVLRIYSPDGIQMTAVPVPGGGPARALSFDPDGQCFVCRGNQVRVLDRFGADTGIVLVPPTGSDKAMDVIAPAPDQIWVTWGTLPLTSRLCHYDLTGAAPGNLPPLQSFGPALMDHPRRLTASPGTNPAEIYIANRFNGEALRFVNTPGSETFNVISDLQAGAVGPVGLNYDRSLDRVWVVGDWGQTTVIGTFDPALNPNAPLSTVLSYGAGAVPGMDAPANCFLDRFRRLYVAGRSSGGGTPGVYIFNAETGTSLVHIVTFPTSGPAPTNIIDVEPQPADVEICGPVDVNGDVIIETGVLHDYKIKAPDFPGAFYVAAMSAPWSGTLDPSFTFAAPDPRGLPFTCDFIFNVTTGVATLGGPSLWFGAPPNVPCPGAPGVVNAVDVDLLVNRFIGTLDINGEASLQIEHLGVLFPFIDGQEFDLSFVVVDLAVANGIGLVGHPQRLVIRTNPSGVTVCP